MSVSAEVLTGTNIVSVTVKGPDPDDVVDLARAISVETIEYVNQLSDVYVLEPLDPPTRPSEPVSTNTVLTILVGLLLGAALGVGMAVLPDYLRRTPAEPVATGPEPHPNGAGVSPAHGDREGEPVLAGDTRPAAAAARPDG